MKKRFAESVTTSINLGKIVDREKSPHKEAPRKAKRFIRGVKKSDQSAKKEKTRYGGEPLPW